LSLTDRVKGGKRRKKPLQRGSGKGNSGQHSETAFIHLRRRNGEGGGRKASPAGGAGKGEERGGGKKIQRHTGKRTKAERTTYVLSSKKQGGLEQKIRGRLRGGGNDKKKPKKGDARNPPKKSTRRRKKIGKKEQRPRNNERRGGGGGQVGFHTRLKNRKKDI